MQSRNLTRILVVVIAISGLSLAQSASTPVSRDSINANYGKLPLTFEANHGQIDSRVKFVSRAAGYTAFLTSEGLVLSLRTVDHSIEKTLPRVPPKHETLQFKILGATKNPVAMGEVPQPGLVNYFIGNNPAKWQKHVPTYAQVRYKNIYPGIDLLYYGNHRQLEFDFAVAPGADPGQIQFEIQGAGQIHLDAEGNLVLTTGGGKIHFQAPTVYQESHGQRLPVNGGYVVSDSSHIGFHVAQHDSTKPLVIDPVLVYSTYLGGSGNDQPSGLAVDSSGNVYVAGSTDSTDFPLSTLGSLPAGSTHVFVAKLDATGSNLIYTDYLGGNSQDYGYALALDSANNVYITGSTASSDFPMVKPFQGTYPGTFNTFLSKISSDGSSLSYSTYFGGNGSDIPAGVAVDGAGNMLIAGYTSSTNLPVANAYQSTVAPNLGGMFGNYGFLTKFSPDGSSLVYSSYFGGNSNVPLNCNGTPCWPQPISTISGLALDASGNAYLGGSTNTYNFPVTSGAYLTTDSTQENSSVGFVSKFTGSGNLQYSTYFYEASGSVTDVIAIAVDSTGSAYVTGVALSDGTFPITSTGICDPSISTWICNFAFVSKFDPTGTTLLYSTFLGPNNNAVPQAIALDSNNDAYVLGVTSSGSFSTVTGIENFSKGNDVLLVKIDAAATTQLFATYLGGSGDDQPGPGALALDGSGNVYVAGFTDSTDFPITPSAFQKQLGGSTDVFILKIGTDAAPAVSLSPASLQFSNRVVGSSSQPQSVLLRNIGSGPLTISSITSSSDFKETNDCGNSVPAAGSCSFSVTFSPVGSGVRVGSIAIQDDAAGSAHLISLDGSGSGAVVGLAPSSLIFPSVPLGSSGTAEAVTLANDGNMDLSIAGIQITGDYAQTNNCPAILSASSVCTINVTFTPAATGVRSGALTISDGAANSPQILGLNGTGVPLAALPVLTPVSLAFPAVPVGSSATVQSISLANHGNIALNISGIQVQGNYAQTNICPAILTPGSTCAISVTFTPTGAGTRTGSLTISDSATDSPQIVGLSGTGLDFTLASAISKVTVKAGTLATYTLTVTPLGGSFANAVKMGCSGAPAKATCSVSPSPVTPGLNSATVTLTINSTAASAALVPLRVFPGQPRAYAIWMQLQGFGLFGIMFAVSKRRSKKLPALVLLMLLVGAMLSMSACAGGTGIAPQPQPGTTPGTYTITVSGTSGTLQHSVPVTLTVQ